MQHRFDYNCAQIDQATDDPCESTSGQAAEMTLQQSGGGLPLDLARLSAI
jgi:hypothetical protein